MVEKDVQKRILKAMYLNGKPMKATEIMKATNLKYGSVAGGTRHLISRALVSKKTVLSKAEWKNPPHKKSFFSLAQKQMHRTIKLIKEFEEGENQ